MSAETILIVAGVVLVGAMVGLISGWIEKPARLSGAVVVSLLVIGVAALVFLTLDRTGAFTQARVGAAAPPASPSVKASPSPSARKKAQRTRAHRSHSPAAGQPGQNPEPSVTSPVVDAANEILSATMSPEEIHNNGQDVEVRVTVTNATPGGQVTWEEDARGSGSYPGQTPCLIKGPSEWCGTDLLHGAVTANSSGVATFDMTFIPGQIYDDLNLTSVSAFDDVIWEATVWDDSTYNSSQATASRTAGCAPGIKTQSSAPPPSQWSRS